MALKDGLYKVQFQTPMGAGIGVVVLNGGKIQGGDSGMYYVGTYTQDGDKFTAEVETNRHTALSGSVFGEDNVHIKLNGTSSGDTAQLTGGANEAPDIIFQAILTRL